MRKVNQGKIGMFFYTEEIRKVDTLSAYIFHKNVKVLERICDRCGFSSMYIKYKVRYGYYVLKLAKHNAIRWAEIVENIDWRKELEND